MPFPAQNATSTNLRRRLSVFCDPSKGGILDVSLGGTTSGPATRDRYCTPGVRCMNTHLKLFELTLRCLGPVFIGSARSRPRRSTTWRRLRVHFPHGTSFLRRHSASQEEVFSAFVMNTDGGARDGATGAEWVGQRNKPDPAKHRGYEVKIGSILNQATCISWSRRGRMTFERSYAQRDSRFHQRPFLKAFAMPGPTVGRNASQAFTCSRFVRSAQLIVFRDTRRGSTGRRRKVSGRSCANRGAPTPVQDANDPTLPRRSGHRLTCN